MKCCNNNIKPKEEVNNVDWNMHLDMKLRTTTLEDSRSHVWGLTVNESAATAG